MILDTRKYKIVMYFTTPTDEKPVSHQAISQVHGNFVPCMILLGRTVRPSSVKIT